MQCVVAAAGTDAVVAVTAVEDIITESRCEGVVADTAVEDVIAGSRCEGVVAVTAVKEVVAVSATKNVAPAFTDEVVIGIGSVNGVIPGACINPSDIGSTRGINAVISCCADNPDVRLISAEGDCVIPRTSIDNRAITIIIVLAIIIKFGIYRFGAAG